MVALLAAGALWLHDSLERAGENEPGWVMLSIDNESYSGIIIEALTMPGSDPREPSMALPLRIEGTDGRRRAALRFRYGADAGRARLVVRRDEVEGSETLDFAFQPTLGGQCTVRITILADGMRAGPCGQWVPTYLGWPH